MIISDKDESFSSNIDKENGTEFRIAASPIAFKILISSIYEHKIAAIVRELCANALDSHVAAGKENVPFRVNLPSAIYPYFEVEDYGVGIDENDAKEIYTVFFASTKRATNSSIGGFGIGGKTPLAYTNQFNVRFRKDGIERTAMVYMDESGAPRMDIILTQKTDAPNGVMVQVPVAPSDFSSFHSEAALYLSFYDVPPVFTGPEHIVNDGTIDFLYPGVAAELRSSNMAASPNRWKKFFAVMGPVPYEFSMESLIDSVEDNRKLKLFDSAIADRNHIFFKFDIGELEVAASRETLSMERKTKQLLTERVSAYVDEFFSGITEELNDETVHVNKRVQNAVTKYGVNKSTVIMLVPSISEKLNRRLKIAGAFISRYATRYRGGNVVYSEISNTPYHPITMENVLISSIGGKWVRMENGGVEANVVRIVHTEKGARIPASVLREESPHFCIRGKLTETKKRRIASYLGVDVEFIDYDEIHKKILEERREERKRNSTCAVNRKRVKYLPTEVRGTYYVVTAGSEVEFYPDSVVDIEKFEHVYRLDKYCDLAEIAIMVKKAVVVAELDIEVCLIKENTRILKKLLDNNVPKFKDFYKKLYENSDKLKQMTGVLAIANNIRSVYDFLVCWYGTSVLTEDERNNLISAVDSGIVSIKKDTSGDWVVRTSVNQLTTMIVEDNSEEYTEMFESIRNRLSLSDSKIYPMIYQAMKNKAWIPDIMKEDAMRLIPFYDAIWEEQKQKDQLQEKEAA